MFLPTRYYQPTAALGGVRAFHPTQLPDLVALYDVSDLSSLFVERENPVTPASVDGVVGTVLDRSGKGNHWIAPSDAARPVLRQDGDFYYADLDGTDDGFFNDSFVGASEHNHLMHVMRLPGDQNFFFLSDDSDFTNYVGRIQTNVNLEPQSDSGSPTYYVNGDEVTAENCAQLKSSLLFNSVFLAEARDFDMTGWGGYIRFGFGSNSFWLLEARLYATAIFNSPLTGSDWDNMRQWLVENTGVSL